MTLFFLKEEGPTKAEVPRAPRPCPLPPTVPQGKWMLSGCLPAALACPGSRCQPWALLCNVNSSQLRVRTGTGKVGTQAEPPLCPGRLPGVGIQAGRRGDSSRKCKWGVLRGRRCARALSHPGRRCVQPACLGHHVSCRRGDLGPQEGRPRQVLSNEGFQEAAVLFFDRSKFLSVAAWPVSRYLLPVYTYVCVCVRADSTWS